VGHLLFAGVRHVFFLGVAEDCGQVKRLSAKRWRLVQDHLGMVSAAARDVVAMMPPSVTVQDLESVGKIALIEAAGRYDHQLGTFGVYARQRVRGSMIDAYRRRNWAWELHAELAEEPIEDDGDCTPFEHQGCKVVPIDRGPSPEKLAERAVLRDILSRAMDCLDVDERYALQQSAEGVSLRAIGAVYGMSTSWAWDLLQRAKANMRRELAMHRLNDAA